MLTRRRGFTLIELIMVITILAILAVVAIPRFINLRQDAQLQAERGIAAAVGAGAQIHKAKWLIDPNSTDLTTTNEYPTTWQNCLDEDTTADVDADYNITYDSTTGNATAAAK